MRWLHNSKHNGSYMHTKLTEKTLPLSDICYFLKEQGVIVDTVYKLELLTELRLVRGVSTTTYTISPNIIDKAITLFDVLDTDDLIQLLFRISMVNSKDIPLRLLVMVAGQWLDYSESYIAEKFMNMILLHIYENKTSMSDDDLLAVISLYESNKVDIDNILTNHDMEQLLRSLPNYDRMKAKAILLNKIKIAC